jgi:hypothetical protein
MADTLTQFDTRIRRYLRETNKATSFWSESFLQQMFNKSYLRRCGQLIMAYEGWFTVIATRDLTANKDRYGFPTGLQRLLKLELVRSGGRTQPLERWERHDESNSSSNSAGAGDQYFPRFRPLGNGFVLEPGPNETVSDGIRMEYTGLPQELTGSGDAMHPSFPEIYDELVVLDTVVTALYAEGLHEMGPSRAINKMREEWEWDWDRFIDNRVVMRNKIDPFIPHYPDS